MHPLRITLKADGTTAIVSHPAYHNPMVASIAGALGTTTECKRAGHVYPVNPIARACFRTLRKVAGSSGRVAEWTRGWPGRWIVVLVAGGCLPGTFPSHSAAVDAEVQYIEEELI